MINKESDYDLVEKFLAGDQNAFNIIAERYGKRIYLHARRMLGNHLDAEEVMQEVLIVMYNKLSSFEFRSNLYTWIYKITSTRSLNYIKKRKIKKFFSIDDKDARELSSHEDIIFNYENKEKLKKLDEYLKQLPRKQREVFILRNFEELSYEEISEITGTSIGGLKANYFHAYNKIEELMKKEL